jgi:hypothetical protein
MLVKCLEANFKIRVSNAPSIYTGVLIERCMDDKKIKMHEGHYVRALLE